MNYSKRKLPQELVDALIRVEIGMVRPFSSMLTPVYLFLPKNEKLVSIKAPLDYFTVEELQKYKDFTYLYYPTFLNCLVPFQEAGKKLREVLEWKKTSKEMPPSSFALADQTLKILGPLWWDCGEGVPGIEPFMAMAFVEMLCDPISEKMLTEARAKSFETLDRALMISSWGVFLALHLGYCELGFINNLRIQIFNEVSIGDKRQNLTQDIDDLIEVSISSFQESKFKVISSQAFKNKSHKSALKLLARLNRVGNELLSKLKSPPSIYGKQGFLDD